MPDTETMTPTQARLWLASLEKDCPLIEGAVSFPFCESHCVCKGTGKVPVLDLREPCSYNRRHESGPYYTELSPSCPKCHGREWLPKQGRDALHDAMHKDGWDYDVYQREFRNVAFYKLDGRKCILGKDTDDWLAAVKAMKAAGYSI